MIRFIRWHIRKVRDLDREPVYEAYEPCPELPTQYQPANAVTMPLPAYRMTLLDAVRAYTEDDNARRAQLAEFGYETLGV